MAVLVLFLVEAKGLPFVVEWGLVFIAVLRLLIAVASLAEDGL